MAEQSEERGPLSMSKTSNVEASCSRADCEGWQGAVTYSQEGEHAGQWTLPVRERCAALDAFLASNGDEIQDCPLAALSGRTEQAGEADRG